MKANYKSLFGATIIIGAIVCAYSYHSAMIRQQYLAEIHFQVLANAMIAEARAQLADKSRAGIQDTVKAGSSLSVDDGKAELSYDWEIASRDSTAGDADIQTIARTVETKLQQMVNEQQLALHYYYPKAQITISTSVVDSKFFNKPALLVSLKCNS